MKKVLLVSFVTVSAFISCKKDTATVQVGKDPNTAEKVSVDRFSATAGHLFIRSATNGFPAANAPVDFDAMFTSNGFAPDGTLASYYNFDAQLSVPDNIYVFFKKDGTTQVSGQLNVINSLPGDVDYNDFWNVNKVIVPDDYVANVLTSEDEIIASGYTIEKTTNIVNCPVVPEGSTATKRFGGGASAAVHGWMKDKIVSYFEFDEKAISTTTDGSIPLSSIFVTFNINPDANNPESGPASGFKTETGTSQTHNVVANIPADLDYSPYWTVLIYDNTSFDAVTNLSAAEAAPSFGIGGLVNCPVISVQ